LRHPAQKPDVNQINILGLPDKEAVRALPRTSLGRGIQSPARWVRARVFLCSAALMLDVKIMNAKVLDRLRRDAKDQRCAEGSNNDVAMMTRCSAPIGRPCVPRIRFPNEETTAHTRCPHRNVRHGDILKDGTIHHSSASPSQPSNTQLKVVMFRNPLSQTDPPPFAEHGTPAQTF
jgi:hypothetical protein